MRWGCCKMEMRFFVGVLVFMAGIIWLISLTGNQNLSLIQIADNGFYEYELFNDINNSSTTINLPFVFDQSYLDKYYEISNGEMIYLNHINVYCEEFKNNATSEYIESITINNNLYVPENLSYEYSLVLVPDSLNSKSQNLTIEKSSGLFIDKITISYKGADYNNNEDYDSLNLFITILLIFSGIILIISGIA